MFNKRAEMNKVAMMMVLLIYMVLATTFISLVGASYNSDVQEVGGLGFNIITGLSIIPTWLSVILFLIPSIMIGVLIIAMFT